MTEISYSFVFDYPYDGFPQEISLFISAEFQEKNPHVNVTWITPDGREIRIGSVTAESSMSYRISQDKNLVRRLDGEPHEALFADPDESGQLPSRGPTPWRSARWCLKRVPTWTPSLWFMARSTGWEEPMHRRRDLMVALLWGTPVALAFGLLAAVGTTITTMIISGVGTWFGGWVDGIIQRITEVNMILPLLPILIMVGTFYSKSIWLMLGVLILLNIFGGGIKTYRAIFLQVKESPYMEAAKAYGASNTRMIFSLPDPAHHPDADPAAGGPDPHLCLHRGVTGRSWGWAILCCPPGARLSTTRGPAALCTRGCTTGCWSPLSC